MKTPEQLAWEARVPENFRDQPGFEFVAERPGLPRVLLIGDSISIGYTPGVRRRLDGKANVLRPPSNCRHTREGLELLDGWLGDQPWDVIHFNFGLHDIKHVKAGALDLAGERVHMPDQYRANLEELVRRLEESGTKLIWAATTPVPDGAAGRRAGDEITIDAIARDIMEAHKITINDLHAAMLPHLERYQKPQNVHFTEEGDEFLAGIVAQVIQETLRDSGTG